MMIEILCLDASTGKMVSIAMVNTFSMLRGMDKMRLAGQDKDLLVVGSDSGVMIVLEVKDNKFVRVFEEPFSRSGTRRTLPGQFVAADPAGRSIMIAALDRQKLVYPIRKNDEDKYAATSPLEAHQPDTVCFDLCALETGFDNPLFAALEVDYTEGEEKNPIPASLDKLLVFYECDMGLNVVRRKAEMVVDRSANHLLPLPCHPDGPGGVLVCSQESITWWGLEQNKSIPMPFESGILVAHVVVKAKKLFFALLLNEQGDLFKVSVDWNEAEVSGLRIRYFDSIGPCTSLAIFKQGFLFAGAETAPHHTLYQIQELGDQEDESEVSDRALVYQRRPLRNISSIDTLPNYAPLTDATVMNLGNEETPQVYTCQGRDGTASFNILRHGLQVSEIAVSPLPSNPTGIWTLKENLSVLYDALIVISFTDSTTILSIGESIEEVTDASFHLDKQTLGIGLMADDSFIQVHSGGMRMVRTGGKYIDYKVPMGTKVVNCVLNARQVVLYLESQILMYYELDLTGSFREVQVSQPLPETILSMHIGPVPEGRQRTRFLAIGCSDDAVRVISLFPEDLLEPLSVQALTSLPTSVLLQEIDKTQFLFVGLSSGIYIRLAIDSNGALTDPRSRQIGTSPIKLSSMIAETAQGQDAAIIAMCSRSWLNFSRQGKMMDMTSLFYEPFEHACGFRSEQFASAVVGTVGASLRIIAVDDLDVAFSRHSIPLPLMCRKFFYQEGMNKFLLLEMEAGQSILQLLNPYDGSLTNLLRVGAGHTILSATFCTFHTHLEDRFLAVGLAKDFTMLPRRAQSCQIVLYQQSKDTDELILVHVTDVEQIPSCMIAFDGRLLVGIGSILRLYDVGKKKMLRKCETRIQTHAVSIQSQGRRLYIADACESVHCVLYLPDDNRFFLFADDSLPRACTALLLLDHDTIAVADKFGSFAVLRIPAAISEDLDSDPSASRLNEREVLQGAPNKLERVCEFHLGDTITSLSRCTLAEGARQVIFYCTVSGAFGVFLPLTTQSSTIFFQNLELSLRNPGNPITLITSKYTAIDAQIGRTAVLFPTARDHLRFRSHFVPVKGVIDGDLCELFGTLVPEDWRKDIAVGIERDEDEILKRIQDQRLLACF